MRSPFLPAFVRLRPIGAAAVLTLTLAACGGGGSATAQQPEPAAPAPTPAQPVEQTPAQKIAALEQSGALPTLDRSVSLPGPDANGNGVRDDVDALIASKYTDSAQRAAATQLAASLQAALLVDKANPSAVKAVSVRTSRSINCVYQRFDGVNGGASPAAVVQELGSVTTNTKARLLEHLAYSKALDGSVISLAEGNTCE